MFERIVIFKKCRGVAGQIVILTVNRSAVPLQIQVVPFGGL